jgi:mevalonate pyrophosphate decarboxylase
MRAPCAGAACASALFTLSTHSTQALAPPVSLELRVCSGSSCSSRCRGSFDPFASIKALAADESYLKVRSNKSLLRKGKGSCMYILTLPTAYTELHRRVRDDL